MSKELISIISPNIYQLIYVDTKPLKNYLKDLFEANDLIKKGDHDIKG